MKNPKQIFSAEQLYEKAWNEPYYYSANNTIMVHIRNLRKKIEKDPANPVYIKTIWGKGYRLGFFINVLKILNSISVNSTSFPLTLHFVEHNAKICRIRLFKCPL